VPGRWRRRHDNEARLLAFEEILDHDALAGAGLARQHRVDRRTGLVDGSRHHDAFARGQAIGLDHDGGAVLADIGACRVGIGKAAVLRGRDAMPLHEGLCIVL
jgi:hypothetical protein